MAGYPLGDLPILSQNSAAVPLNTKGESKISIKAEDKSNTLHSPAAISFVHHRMLYARAALNAQGGVRFGLRHIRMSLIAHFLSLLIV
jgi:hypothetical protein